MGCSLRERGERGLQARGPASSIGRAGLRVCVRAGSGELCGALGCSDHHGPELGIQETGLRCVRLPEEELGEAFPERGLQLLPSVSECGALGGHAGTGHYCRETRGLQDRLEPEGTAP